MFCGAVVAPMPIALEVLLASGMFKTLIVFCAVLGPSPSRRFDSVRIFVEIQTKHSVSRPILAVADLPFAIAGELVSQLQQKSACKHLSFGLV